jgi:hypothetical protein
MGATLMAATTAEAQVFTPGNLLVTTSTYTGTAGLVTPNVTELAGASAPQTVLAAYDGSYAQVFGNTGVDAAFGVTTPITVEQLTPAGVLVSTLSIGGAVTSFSSKSEMGLQPTADGTGLTFMGYVAPVNAIDVSNSNTPAVTDPTNPVTNSMFGGPYSRAIITLNSDGTSSVIPVWGYSGNNGRGAILDNGIYYMVGNAGNSGSPKPAATILDELSANTGVQYIQQGNAGATTVLGAYTNTSMGNTKGDQYGFNITSVGGAADNTGKDDNFRGITLYNNTLYVSKGSGGNGIDTVYQVGTAGTLPTAATASSVLITILPGLPGLSQPSTYHPFGLFFANPNTLYVADEGGQVTTDEVGGSTYATNNGGLQKWTFNGSTWTLQYTLTAGLNLGVGYTVSGTVTDSTGSVTQYPDGLRHLAGVVNGNNVTIYATTSTVGGLGDQGASPNQLVVITDSLSAAGPTAPAEESFTLLQTAAYGQVLRGVQFAPTVLPAAGQSPAVAVSAQSIDAGQASTLSATPAGSGSFTYQWYAGSSGNTSHPIAGATGPRYTAAPTATTSYWVQITNSNGIVENSTTITITVNNTTDGPLPLWALGALGAGIVGAARRRLRKAPTLRSTETK